MLSKLFGKADEPKPGKKQIKIEVSVVNEDGTTHKAIFTTLQDFQIWLIDVGFV